MISMDISEMNRLTDTLIRSSAKSDEALYIIRRLRDECGDDPLLKAYPQYEAIIDDLLTAEKSSAVLKETLYDLGKVVSNADESYIGSEAEKAGHIRSGG